MSEAIQDLVQGVVDGSLSDDELADWLRGVYDALNEILNSLGHHSSSPSLARTSSIVWPWSSIH